jgi:hypothetical protein
MGAHDTAALLRAIQRIMAEHGVTHERLRAILPAYKSGRLRTCRMPLRMSDLVGRGSEELYIHDRMQDREGEDVFCLLSACIRQRRDELVALLEACRANDASA